MDIKKPYSRLRHRRRGKKGDTAQLAAQLAPLEEQNTQAAVKQQAPSQELSHDRAVAEFSGIVVDNTDVHVPHEVLEGSDEKTFMGMEPVVIVILGVMLTFILFVTWQISLMPME